MYVKSLVLSALVAVALAAPTPTTNEHDARQLGALLGGGATGTGATGASQSGAAGGGLGALLGGAGGAGGAGGLVRFHTTPTQPTFSGRQPCIPLGGGGESARYPAPGRCGHQLDGPFRSAADAG